MNRFGRSLTLLDLTNLDPFDVLVTGASAISTHGTRFGKGHGFFDLEWGILRELGVANDDTPVIACIHDCQLVDAELPATEHDTVVDWIVTPTETFKVIERSRKPSGIHWDHVTPSLLEEIAPLAELNQTREAPVP